MHKLIVVPDFKNGVVEEEIELDEVANVFDQCNDWAHEIAAKSQLYEIKWILVDEDGNVLLTNVELEGPTEGGESE